MEGIEKSGKRKKSRSHMLAFMILLGYVGYLAGTILFQIIID